MGNEIEETSGIPYEVQRLVYKETELKNTEALTKYFVDEEADVLLLCQALELPEWKHIQQNIERWRVILAAVQNAGFSEPGPLRVVAHQLWPLGPLGDADWNDSEFVRKVAKEEVSLLALASLDVTSDRTFA